MHILNSGQPSNKDFNLFSKSRHLLALHVSYVMRKENKRMFFIVFESFDKVQTKYLSRYGKTLNKMFNNTI